MGAHSALIILLLLKKENSWGYKILHDVASISNQQIKWKEGSLYPVLKKLETKKFISSFWDATTSKRPRKYYKISKIGLNEIDLIQKERALFNKVIDDLLEN